jgi:hypothetical protein
MSVSPHSSDAPPVKPSRIPPLESGDHLTREEFERRFDATPGLKKAELINGVVYMPPPVSLDWHSEPHFECIGLLSTYRRATPGVRGGDNGSIRLDLGNMPQPDIFLIISPEAGGQARIDEERYVVGAPEFVCEIAGSSASMDLNHKLDLYRRHGVKEYLVWRTFDGVIDYFVAQGGSFDRLSPEKTGEHRSRILPGLWIDTPAMLSGKWDDAVATLGAGIASPEHTAFVAELRARAARSKPAAE